MKKTYIRKNSSSEAAFTLLELMITIAIIAIMSAIAIPNLINPENKLKKAARELMGDMQKTRSMAIKTNKEWAIIFSPSGKKYFICSARGTDNSWALPFDSDNSQTIEKELDFTGYGAGISYATSSTNPRPNRGTVITGWPADGISYTGNILAFNSKGMVNTSVSGSGEQFVYLYYRAGSGNPTEYAYAVGTESTGVVKILYWDGGNWK